MTTTRKTVPSRTRTKVIEMYLGRVPLAQITADTGVPRATIFMLLKQEGIRPNRTGGGFDEQSTGELIDQIRRVERENGALREQLAEAHKRAIFFQYIAMLLDQIGMAPPPGCRSWVPDFQINDPNPVDPVTLPIALKNQVATQPARPRRQARGN